MIWKKTLILFYLCTSSLTSRSVGRKLSRMRNSPWLRCVMSRRCAGQKSECRRMRKERNRAKMLWPGSPHRGALLPKESPHHPLPPPLGPGGEARKARVLTKTTTKKPTLTKEKPNNENKNTRKARRPTLSREDKDLLVFMVKETQKKKLALGFSKSSSKLD